MDLTNACYPQKFQVRRQSPKIEFSEALSPVWVATK